MPSGEELDSFLSRVEIMAEMDGPGAEPELVRANAIFVAEAAALRQAVHKRDAAALAEVLARLDRRKGACHAQFK
jgi:XXXCH domain-containing protein